MRKFTILPLSASVFFSVSSPVGASGDLSEKYCRELLDKLGVHVADFKSGESLTDLSDEEIARYSYLSFLERYLQLKVKYCLYVLYHDDDYHSPHQDDDGKDWEQAWTSSH